MKTFERCNTAFDDSGRGQLRHDRQILAEVSYFLFYDKVFSVKKTTGRENVGVPDVHGQFETIDSIPEIQKKDRYTLCLQSGLELDIEIRYIHRPATNSVSCEFEAVGDSVKTFYLKKKPLP